MNIRSLTNTILATILLSLAFSIAAKPSSEAITIWSNGVRLAGDLWKPAGLKAEEKRPALLMMHGWGGTKAHLNQAYAPQFAELGYIVLTFDYRGWGESDGKLIRVGDKPADVKGDFQLKVREVRTVVDPLDQLEDIRAAHAYLVGEAQVEADRLAVWGSSLGGGLSLQSAASLSGVKVLIDQVGAVQGLGGGPDTAENPMSASNMLRLRSAVSRGDQPPFPGPESKAPGLSGFPDFHRFDLYKPFTYADQLTAATLIIDARDEELFDIKQNGVALYSKIKDRITARYEAIPGKHYDIYTGEGYNKAMELEKAWLQKHLPIK
tara:strand:- start:11848 stop:12813 length:966 start_codon:yes stop_codon:yes gene_type:complete